MTPKQADNAATAERETAQLREERDEARAQRDANAESIAFVKEGRDQQLGELQRRINELNGIRIRVVDERDEYAARLTAAEATVAQLRAENEQLRSARVSSPGEIPGGVVTSPTALHQLTTLRSWPVVVSP